MTLEKSLRSVLMLIENMVNLGFSGARNGGKNAQNSEIETVKGGSSKSSTL